MNWWEIKVSACLSGHWTRRLGSKEILKLSLVRTFSGREVDCGNPYPPAARTQHSLVAIAVSGNCL